MSMKIWKWLLSSLKSLSSNQIRKKAFFCRFIQRFDKNDFHQNRRTHIYTQIARINSLDHFANQRTDDVVCTKIVQKSKPTKTKYIKPVNEKEPRAKRKEKERDREKTKVAQEFSHQYNISCRPAHDKCCTLFGLLLVLCFSLFHFCVLWLVASCWLLPYEKHLNIVYFIFISLSSKSEILSSAHEYMYTYLLSRLSQLNRE